MLQINKLTNLWRRQFLSLMVPFTQQSQYQLQPLLIPTTTTTQGQQQQQQPSSSLLDTLQDALWFAVPKSKISRSKKRMKTTAQKRIPLKKNIIVDPRTGEYTLKHKLPFNWKDYLPKTDWILNEMKWNEMKWNEMKWNEMKWNEMKWMHAWIKLSGVGQCKVIKSGGNFTSKLNVPTRLS